MDKDEIIRRLKKISRHAVRFVGESPLILSLDDGIALDEAVRLLKEQEDLKQKMWNALYSDEDKLEKNFIGTEEHDDWFTVYRPWLQRGFEIAIKVIAEQDGM